LGLDGQPKPQVLVDVVTLGDIEIRIEETNSTSLKVSWDEVYEGAQYVLVYTEEDTRWFETRDQLSPRTLYN